MAAKKTSIQLRFKRADVSLTPDKIDTILEVPLAEELRGALQRYGEWDYEHLNERSQGAVCGTSGGASLQSSTTGEAADRHGSDMAPQGLHEPRQESHKQAERGGTSRDGQRSGPTRHESEEASKHWERLNFLPVGKVWPGLFHTESAWVVSRSWKCASLAEGSYHASR